MPIDYQSILDQKQKELNDALSSQGPNIDAQMNNTRANIVNGRKPVFDALSRAAAGVSPSAVSGINSGIAMQTPLLNRATDNLLSSQRFGNQGQLNTLKLNNLTGIADRGQSNLRDSNNFSRTFTNQNQANDFSAQQAEKQRQQQLAMSQLADQYAAQGINVQNQYANMVQPDFNGALTRLLFGTGSMLGTSYVMNKNAPKFQQQTAGNNGYGVPSNYLPIKTAGIGGITNGG